MANNAFPKESVNLKANLGIFLEKQVLLYLRIANFIYKHMCLEGILENILIWIQISLN